MCGWCVCERERERVVAIFDLVILDETLGLGLAHPSVHLDGQGGVVVAMR